MSARLLTVAAKLPLWWAAWYTAGLPRPVRTARRAEIASDTYEHLGDSAWADRRGGLARDIMQSFVRGLADDLRWRASQVSVAGNFVQSLLAGVPFGLVAGYIVYHITSAAGVAAAVGLGSAVAAAVLLIVLGHSEGAMFTPSRSYESGDRGGDWLTGLTAILYPILVLAAMLMIPMASGDPAGDEADIAKRAAEGTTRWATGFAIYAVGAACGLVAVLGISRRTRESGARGLGLAAAVLFLLGSVGVIAVGHGVAGLGLAAAIESGADGEEYLNAEVWPMLLSFIGGVLCGLGLWALGAAVWRSRILGGWSRNVCVAAMAIEGLMVGLGAGHGVGPVLLAGPICGIVAFGLLVRELYFGDAPGERAAASGPPLAPAG